MISGSAGGMPDSEASSSSRKAAASKVSFFVRSPLLTGNPSRSCVKCGSSHQETEVEWNRESVATTLFQFTVESEKRSRVEFGACV